MNPEDFIAESASEALLQDACKALRADVAALRKDAERYRWLRDRGAVGGMRGIFSLMPGQWDEAIDAAMPGKPAVGAA